MPISATGKGTDRPVRRASAGLTLVELVVVVAILGLLALPAMLRFGGGGVFGGPSPAARVAGALEADLSRLRDLSLLGRQRLELTAQTDGWTTEAGRGATFDGVRLSWRIGDGGAGRELGTGSDGMPPVRFLPDGRATPFTLRIDADAARPLDCSFDGWEGMECTPR